jgi:hypothetical protein
MYNSLLAILGLALPKLYTPSFLILLLILRINFNIIISTFILITCINCDEHISGLLRASVGGHAAPLYMQVAVLRVKEVEFSLLACSACTVHFVRIQQKQYSEHL